MCRTGWSSSEPGKQLRASRADSSYERQLLRFTATNLLIINDLGLRPLSSEEPVDLYKIIRKRYQWASTLLTSNRAVDELPALFGDALLASAAMDRLLHGATSWSLMATPTATHGPTVCGRSYERGRRAQLSIMTTVLSLLLTSKVSIDILVVMSGRKAPARKLTKAQRVRALRDLFDQNSRLFHRLRVVAEQVHHQGTLSAGLRGVLRSLAQHGPQTVPQLARMRPVSRQHIQHMVNDLIEHGYVEFLDNPEHKRSQLVQLSPEGKEHLAAMQRREYKVLATLEVAVSLDDLTAAIETLRAVRAAFETEEWSQRSEDDT